MPKRDDQVFDDIPSDAASGKLTAISDNEDELGALLLRLMGGAMIALQLLNEAGPETHRAVKYRVTTLKSIVSQMPSEPLRKDPPTKMRQPAGFRPFAKKEPDDPGGAG